MGDPVSDRNRRAAALLLRVLAAGCLVAPTWAWAANKAPARTLAAGVITALVAVVVAEFFSPLDTKRGDDD